MAPKRGETKPAAGAKRKREVIVLTKREGKPAAVAPAATTRLTRSAAAGKRVAPEAVPAKAAPKKPKLAEKKAKAKVSDDGGKGEAKGPGGEASKKAPKTIIVEACKQCNSFKTRAVKVKEGLESAVAGITVEINPEKPRRGCFEIRDADGIIFLSLLDMKRPFKPMKDLDMDEVIVGIAKKIS